MSATQDNPFLPGTRAFSSDGRTEFPGTYLPCPVPDSEQLDLNLIPDCIIPEIPPPFFEAPVQIPIPPVPPMGCYPIQFSIAATKGGPLEALSMGAKFVPLNDNNCMPRIEFNLKVPFGCPLFNVNVTADTGGTSGEFGVTISNTQNNAPNCAYDFDFKAKFPCTNITHTGSSSTSFGGGSVGLTGGLTGSSGSCTANVGTTVRFPCTEVNITSTQPAYSWTRGDLTEESNIKNAGSACSTDIRLKPTFICTTVEGISSNVISTDISALNFEGGLTFKKEPSECKLTLESDLKLTCSGGDESVDVSKVDISSSSISATKKTLKFKCGMLTAIEDGGSDGSIDFQDCP